MKLISEIELLRKWLINHDDKELSINANSRYGVLIQTREYINNKYGNDIYNEIITGKKVIKNKKIKVLSYKPEPATIQISFSEPEYIEYINNIKTEIHNPEIQIWNEIVNSILGTYWDYAYVKKTVMDNIYTANHEPSFVFVSSFDKNISLHR